MFGRKYAQRISDFLYLEGATCARDIVISECDSLRSNADGRNSPSALRREIDTLYSRLGDHAARLDAQADLIRDLVSALGYEIKEKPAEGARLVVVKAPRK
jgi:hypothetical protein